MVLGVGPTAINKFTGETIHYSSAFDMEQAARAYELRLRFGKYYSKIWVPLVVVLIVGLAITSLFVG